MTSPRSDSALIASQDTLWRRVHPSPVGELTLLAGVAGLRELTWPSSPGGMAPVVLAESVRDDDAPQAVAALLDEATRQLDEYFAGTRTTFDVPLDPVGTEFQRRAWEALRAIPYGTTRTYAEQARAIGSPRATRAVGAANGRNPISIIVPCHRVIGADGSLTGFGGGLAAKRFLLELERSDATLF